MSKADLLKTYRAKRDFSKTAEPSGEDQGESKTRHERVFVIQKHWATRLHYDFRLELEGAMKSWAVPKGPSFDPNDKRMAVHVEDHPISYNRFEGQIPAGQYGAGKVIIWDKGHWIPLEDPHKGYRDGKLKFELRGLKLKGKWALVRMKNKEGEKQEPWLLIKEKDEYVRPASEFSVVDEMPDSVVNSPSQGNLELPARENDNSRSKQSSSEVAEGAVKAPLPLTLQPELATLVDEPPGNSVDWVYEIKFDGYRMLARKDAKEVRLITRNGNDWSHKLPHLVKAISKMKLKSGWLDGEIAMLNDNGLPDFQSLQNAFESEKTRNIVYYLFDIPFSNGYDLRSVPLVERRALLKRLFEQTVPDPVRFSDVFEAAPGDIVASACRLGLEGVIGKRKNSSYVSRRSDDWIKLKCSQRQEFVIGGYTDPKGSRTGIGSLLLGFYDEEKKLRYAGNVGTGFSDYALRDLKEKLDKIAGDHSPFDIAAGIDRKAHWVKPTLVAEVSFGEWTRHGHIRHSVFQGLRVDKKPAAVGRERAVHPTAGKPAAAGGAKQIAGPTASAIPSSLKVTHPERVVDPSSGITKIEVVRAPDGISGQLFFQKHWEKENIDGVNQLDPDLDRDHQPLLEIATAGGLLGAVQMNVLEFHTWNAKKDVIDKPDRITFDLDPGEGVEWARIQESAQLVRVFLKQLKLESFLKTSGGKGLHVVVPIKRLNSWDTVKDFSQAVVQHLAETIPQRFVAKSGPRNRVGKIFIDYLRNGFGATTVAAWSIRARSGLGVSVPLAWEELESLTSGARWSVSNIHERLDRGNEPWREYEALKQSISPAMKILGFKPGK
jgi:bifunctional non-homologous end joining protein LigD